MLEIVQLPLARRMWKLSKFFKIPLNDERMQDINPYDLEFYELSMIADDPKKLEQLQNHFYDDEFEDWLDDFDREQEEKQQKSSQDEKFGQSEQLDLPDEETIEWAKKNSSSHQENASELPFEDDYEVSLPTDKISDWKEVN